MKTMDTLFELPPEDKPETYNGNVCGKCKYAVRPHCYRNDWLYCELKRCNRTQFGIQKVKSRQQACEQYEESVK